MGHIDDLTQSVRGVRYAPEGRNEIERPTDHGPQATNIISIQDSVLYRTGGHSVSCLYY